MCAQKSEETGEGLNHVHLPRGVIVTFPLCHWKLHVPYTKNKIWATVASGGCNANLLTTLLKIYLKKIKTVTTKFIFHWTFLTVKYTSMRAYYNGITTVYFIDFIVLKNNQIISKHFTLCLLIKIPYQWNPWKGTKMISTLNVKQSIYWK